MAKSTKSTKTTKTAKAVKNTKATKTVKVYSTKSLAEKTGVSTAVVRNAIDNGVIKNFSKNKSGRFEIPAADGDKFVKAMKSTKKPETYHTVTVSGAAKWAGKNDSTIRYHVKNGHIRSMKGRAGLIRVSASDVAKVFGLNKGKDAEAK